MCHPDDAFRRSLKERFRPRGQASELSLGLLVDEDGDILDEVLLEEGHHRILIHAHEGVAVHRALTELLTSLGARVAPARILRTLDEELEWALETATSEAALNVALRNMKALPAISRATPGILGTLAAGFSLFNPEPILLYGAPNAGKSTLLNALAGRERSVVHAEAGTTRDLVEVEIPLGGRQVRLVDAAGIREATENLESAGIALARAAAGGGRVLWVVNPHQPTGPAPSSSLALVLTHQDLGRGKSPSYDGPVLHTSLGDDAVDVRDFLTRTLPPIPEGPVIFTARQKAVVERCLASGSWDQASWVGA